MKNGFYVIVRGVEYVLVVLLKWKLEKLLKRQKWESDVSLRMKKLSVRFQSFQKNLNPKTIITHVSKPSSKYFTPWSIQILVRW